MTPLRRGVREEVAAGIVLAVQAILDALKQDVRTVDLPAVVARRLDKWCAAADDEDER